MAKGARIAHDTNASGFPLKGYTKQRLSLRALRRPLRIKLRVKNVYSKSCALTLAQNRSNHIENRTPRHHQIQILRNKMNKRGHNRVYLLTIISL